MTAQKRGTCQECGRDMQLKKDGTVFHHGGSEVTWLGHRVYRCKGAGLLPRDAARGKETK